MKNGALLLALALGACHPDEPGDDATTAINENCIIHSELSAPPGFTIHRLSSIDLDGGLDELQMLDDRRGYLLGHRNFGGFATVYRTTDGGSTWEELDLRAEVSPIDLFFADLRLGFLSYYEDQTFLLRTTDGGTTWDTLSFPELGGSMYHIQQDRAGNLYAMLFGLNSSTRLVKSVNQGQSWEMLYADDLDFRLVTFSFRLVHDRIYASGSEGAIIVLDLDGNRMGTIETGQSAFWDVEVIDENNLVVVADQTIRTTDGGQHWQVIYRESARMIGFSTAETGLMILRKGVCPGDVYQVNDIIGYTEDGGVSWTEGRESANLRASFANGQRIGENRYLITLDREIYELRRE